jgi:hypothetical protein
MRLQQAEPIDNGDGAIAGPELGQYRPAIYVAVGVASTASR